MVHRSISNSCVVCAVPPVLTIWYNITPMKKKAAKVPNEAKIAKLVKELLVELGEDPGRDGLKKTPERVARSLSFLTRGYRQDIAKVVNGARFKSGTNHMVILKDIELYSLCEHHMLPFYGKCAIGRDGRGRRRRRDPREAPLHDDARRREAEQRDDDLGGPRYVQDRREGASGISVAHQVKGLR